MSIAEKLERTAGLILSNRFVWLIFSCGLYLILQLSYIQWRSMKYSAATRFDTLELAALIMFILEVTLLFTAVLTIGATEQHCKAWYKRWPSSPFSYTLHGIAGFLCFYLFELLLLVPILLLHSYPQLTEQGYNLVVMFLQRAVLLGLIIQLFSSIILIMKYVLRIPSSFALISGIILYLVFGYTLIYISSSNEELSRLNDLYFYNQLWKYIEVIPNLQREAVFTNMQAPGTPYFTYYTVASAVLWLLSIALWIPASVTWSNREAQKLARHTAE